MLLSLGVFGILICSFISVAFYYFHINVDNFVEVNKKSSDSLVEISGWKIKKAAIAEKRFEEKCELLRIKVDSVNSHMLGDIIRSNVPFIIENAMDEWPAMKKWDREYFQSMFGDRLVKAGDESGIVQNGGTVSQSIPISTVIQKIRMCTVTFSSECSDNFVFDASILTSIPELESDVIIPRIFSGWDNAEKLRNKLAWHILSLGTVETGLPFHSHGKTWLSIVHGAKSWYIYPPGYDLPNKFISNYTSIESVRDLQQRIDTELKTFSPPVHFNSTKYSWKYNNAANREYRPLFCRQNAGEILYLPDLWLHMTVNEGETVAYGGQGSLLPQQRLDNAVRNLEKFSSDFESLRNAGLGMGHLLISRWRRIQEIVRPVGSLIRLSNVDSLSEITELTEDVWIVISLASPSTNEGFFASREEIRQIIFDVARAGNGKWNTAIIDDDAKRLEDRSITGYFLKNVQVRLISKPALQNSVFYNPSKIDSLLAMTEDIVNWISATIHVYYLEDGSVLSGNSRKVTKMLSEASHYLEQAIQLRPLRVESWCFLAEVLGSTGRRSDAVKSINRAITFFNDSFGTSATQNDTVGKRTKAGIYHQLAASLLSLSLPEDAIPVLNQAIDIDSTYISPAVDLVVAWIMTGNKKNATVSLEKFENTFPGHPEIMRLRSLMLSSSN